MSYFFVSFKGETLGQLEIKNLTAIITKFLEKVALCQILFFFVCSFCNIMKESSFWKGADYFA